MSDLIDLAVTWLTIAALCGLIGCFVITLFF
jgi:hypothetical protein